MAAPTASGYIEHHLQNLSLAKFGLVEETSFWNVHIDSLFFFCADRGVIPLGFSLSR